MAYKLISLIIIIILVFSTGTAFTLAPGSNESNASNENNENSFVPENQAITAIEEKLILDAELELSKNPDLYLIFDLREKKIKLKVKGLLLRQWEVDSMRLFGNPIPVTPLPLARKSTLYRPKRENITPNGKEEKKDSAEAKVQAFEVGSMPSEYTLIIGGEIKISIRTKPEDRFFARLANFGLDIKWYTAPPLLALWHKYKKMKPFTLIDIVFKDKKEAQALYWIFTEGAECIIIPPRDFMMLLDFDTTID
ncbi:MAG TPA: hypothetical protein VK469_09050 [Candidatus Kapabacteria bacterium]|nr:hypothetical protein [Candidatus Kapabacteria bacterium]